MPEKITIPDKIRIIMRCNPVTHYCVFNHQELYDFASSINPKNRADYGQLVVNHSLDWKQGFCVVNPGEEIHDLSVFPDNDLRTGIYQVPIQTKDQKNLPYKNKNVKIGSLHQIIHGAVKLSEIINWVYNNGGGTILSVLCRSPCGEQNLTDIKLPLLNDAMQGVPTVHTVYAGLPESYKIADSILRPVSYIPNIMSIYEEGIYIDPEYNVKTLIGYTIRNGISYDILITRQKNKLQGNKLQENIYRDIFQVMDPSGKISNTDITNITGIILDTTIPYIIAQSYQKEVYYTPKEDELYYKDHRGNKVYIIIPSSPYLIGTLKNFNIYAAKPPFGKTVFYMSNVITDEGSVEINPDEIYYKYTR